MKIFWTLSQLRGSYLAMPALTHLRKSYVKATLWDIPTTALLLFLVD